MKLSRREAQVLDALYGKSIPMGQLAKEMGIAPANLSNYAKKLAECGLVRVERNGTEKWLSIDWLVEWGLQGARKNFPELKMADVLAGRAPFAISFAQERGEFGANGLGIPQISAKLLLAKLRKMGILFMPRRGVYRLRKEAGDVAAFCQNVLMRIEGSQAKKEIEGIDMALYSFGSAEGIGAVYRTEKAAKPAHFWPTAYSAMEKFGVKPMLAGKYYYCNFKQDLGDIALHTLAVSQNERGAAFAAALVARNGYDAKKLLKKRHRFVSAEYLGRFVEFVESRGEKASEGMPQKGEVWGNGAV